MPKKLTGRALATFEAERNIWQEVLDGVREIKAGGGKRVVVEPHSPIMRVRLKAGLTQAEFVRSLETDAGAVGTRPSGAEWSGQDPYQSRRVTSGSVA